jgi:hypothetical protein
MEDIEREEFILKLETDSMKSLMKRNNQISAAILLAMITFIIAMFGFFIQNEQSHSSIMLEFQEQNQWTHHVYELNILPADSLSQINANRLDIQSKYGYHKVKVIDSVLNLQFNWIKRNSISIRELKNDTNLEFDTQYKSIINK